MNPEETNGSDLAPAGGRRESHSRSRKLLAVGSGAVLATGAAGAVLFAGGTASAAGSIVVDSLTDDGTGTTLREAIEQANTDAGEDVITFESGLSGTISLLSDLPVVTEALAVEGPGADVITVDGVDQWALFNFHQISTGTNRLSGLTLTHGVADNSDSSGGAVFVYYGSADLEITDMVLIDNSASNDGGAVSLYSANGDVTITRTTITGNTADGGGGALYADEDADLTVTIIDSTISGNTAGDYGGALYVGNTADLFVSDSTISGNSAAEGGGGIYLNAGDVTIERSTISGNTAEGGGGGIGFSTAYSFTMRNSTVSGNSASDWGGGLYISDGNSGPVTIENSTISGNTAGQAGAIYGAYGGLTIIQSTITANTATGTAAPVVGGIQLGGPTAVPQVARSQGRSSNEHGVTHGFSVPAAAGGSGELELDGTIVAGNGGLDIGVYNGSSVAVTSDHSVIGSVDDAISVTDVAGTQLGVTDPGLAPLAANGGPTRTHALVAGSVAIDAGPVPVPTFPGNEYDQRGPGFARVVEGQVDVGAYEVQAAVPPTPADVSGDVVVPAFTG